MSLEQRTVVWRGIAYPSMEFFNVHQHAGGWLLTGSVVAVIDDLPLQVNYEVGCDAGWQTSHVDLTLVTAAGERRRRLEAPGDGRWLQTGQPIAEVAGCIDIDLGITPATNLLPIRRLNLAVGQSADVVATWVRFPTLASQPLSQRYTRLTEDSYRYESDTGFSADLTVDADGLVTTYPGGWERVV
ncbi:MAG TPA: putative glycolipid-binding domain-containing protein [Thermomicrobiales bacterium]|nr:putative glycolipid-binding domain-containing protein [Thermomicrobiales bacterium]